MQGLRKRKIHYYNQIFEIHHSLVKVYPWFANFESFASLHPIISQVKKTPVGNKENSLGVYLVNESARFSGYVPLASAYHIEITEMGKNTQLIYTAQVGRKNYIEVVFNFCETNGKTIIDEEIKIRGSSFDAKRMMKQLQVSHGYIIEKIKVHLSAAVL